jgi:hypothetical protein
MIVLLLFLQKQNLANAIYLFGLGTLLSGLGLKHMRIRSHHDLAGALVTPLLLSGLGLKHMRIRSHHQLQINKPG